MKSTIVTDYEQQRVADMITLLETSIAEMEVNAAQHPAGSVYATYYGGLLYSYKMHLQVMQNYLESSQMMIDHASQWPGRN